MLPSECIAVAMDARSKDAALRQLAALYEAADLGVDDETVYRVFAEREALASTGVGSGVAIPHGRIEDVPGVCLALGLHPEGVDFDAVDGRPVHILVGVLAPNGEASQHLKVLARVSRLLRDPSVRERLIAARDARAAREILVAEDAAA